MHAVMSNKPVREAQATAHVAAAALPLQRARQQRSACSARERRVRVLSSSACAHECERTLHAGAAAAQSPRLR